MDDYEADWPPSCSATKGPATDSRGRLWRLENGRPSRCSTAPVALNAPGDQQDEQDQYEQPHRAARRIAPVPAMRPRGNDPDQHQYENYEQDCDHDRLLSGRLVCRLVLPAESGGKDGASVERAVKAAKTLSFRTL